MYRDVITPKSFPHKLQNIAYDFFGLMPNTLPPHPRVLVSGAEIARAKERVTRVPWAKAALELLLSRCAGASELPDELPVPADGKLNSELLNYTERLALAYLLTDQAAYREQAISLFRRLAVAYPRWPINAGGGRAIDNSLVESHYTHHLGRTFDLLAACGLSEEDDAAFRELLFTAYEVCDYPTHLTCGNHNVMRLMGRLALSSALGDRQGIHDALYGFEKNGRWRYGIIHQLRHDILPDGLHWERTMGYHCYTLMGLTEIVDMAAHIGIDLWHAELPMQRQRDGDDIHRIYGPRGTKTLKVAYDAPFYQMFPGGDYPVLHDSGVVNLRAAHQWGPIYEKAYEAYGDEKYAWLLNKMEREYTERTHPELPMSLQTINGDIDAVRLSEEAYPDSRFSLAGDAAFAPLGRHEQGSTLFPCHGNAVLRSDPEDEQAPSAFLFWGPHNAGHQSPAALHMDLHAGLPLTSAAELGGYGDPSYLTWNRTTIAHNTVTVDETPMFPYDYHADIVAEYDEAYIWESDQWRDTVSDGELKLFQPGRDFSAVRAINENVYPGVLLDRTVIVTREYVIDAFRVISEDEHQYDWAMHCVGDLPVPEDAAIMDLGGKRGYRHLQNARLLPGNGPICWTRGTLPVALHLALPEGAAVMLADDPFKPHTGQGGLEPLMPNHSIIARAQGSSVLFLTCWQIGEPALTFARREGHAASDVLVDVTTSGKTTEWQLPFSSQPVLARELVK